MSQFLTVALRVHAGPEAAVSKDVQLAVSGQADERFTLQHAALLLREIPQKITMKEEVTSVDPVVFDFGFFSEFKNLVCVHLDFTKPRGRIDS